MKKAFLRRYGNTIFSFVECVLIIHKISNALFRTLQTIGQIYRLEHIKFLSCLEKEWLAEVAKYSLMKKWRMKNRILIQLACFSI